MRSQSAFTVIELLVTLAILSVLAGIVLPLAESSVRRSKETELKIALRQIRNALDAYKQAYDDGRLPKQAGASGYPPSLEVLENGVVDISSPNQPMMYFLRRIPRDPFAKQPADKPSWGLRSYSSSIDEPQAGRDVFDVYSLADGVGMNGIPYRQW